MSLQLIVFPQSYNGMNSFTGAGTECVVDGIDFNTVNASSSAQSLSGTLPQAYIDVTSFNVNTWYRFSDSSSEVTEVSGNAVFVSRIGMLQRLSNLTVGAVYDFTIEFNAVNVSGIIFYHYSGTNLIGATTINGVSTINLVFTAQSTTDTILLWGNGATEVASVSVRKRPISASGVSLSNGQVICDLYEDEDIPLTLSVDDFKNVAEQVKSYSKAFKLPGTKRNNLIFDNIFEITRADDGVVFNPYVKTQCTLKQDGFVLFEGYLRMIDISEKKGEVSYNVNLYSEVVALADVLGERDFSKLGFSELEHDYDKGNIKASWSGSVTYTNPNNSGFRSADTLKYPFVDWTHQIVIANGAYSASANVGFPELISFEQAFRPFIQIKYLIDRIFNQTAFPFSYTSTFFNTADFEKLYMDFNWGDETYGAAPLRDDFLKRKTPASNTTVSQHPAWLNIPLSVDNGSGSTALWNNTNYLFFSDVNNLEVTGTYRIQLENTAFLNNWTATMRIIKCNQSGVILETFDSESMTIATGGSGSISGSFGTTLNANEHIKLQATTYNSDGDILTSDTTTSNLYVTYNNESTQTAALLDTARGEVGQWDFLKGIMTMFNLVSVPDKSNPNNILIEPYNDMFLNNADTSELNWTNKIDIEEIKLRPLTDLKRNTIFKFVEDDDDWAFENYRRQVQNHLYGSQIYDATISSSGLETILQGDEEIIAEPFAATVIKPLMSQFQWLLTPSVYSYDPDDDTSKGFANSPRIMYNNGVIDLVGTGNTYHIPSQNVTFS